MNKKLKILRESYNLTPKEISSFLNISSYKYSFFEKNGISIPIDVLVIIAIIYDLPIDILINKNYEELQVIINSNELLYLSKKQLLIQIEKNVSHKMKSDFSYKSISLFKKEIQNNILKNVYKIMREENITCELFSQYTDINISALNSVFSRKRFFTLAELVQISKSFKLSISEILYS